MSALRRCAACALLLWAATSAHAAGPSQATILTPGGFASACASRHMVNFKAPVPGADLQAEFDDFAYSCESNTFSGVGSAATANATYTNFQSDGVAKAYAGMGVIKLSAQEDATNAFPAPAAAGGGWMDKVTVNLPGQAGKSAIWKFQLAVSGTGWVSDPLGGNGSAVRASITGFKNHAELSRSTTGWNAGSGTAGIGQTFSWVADAANRSFAIDELVTFAMPVTLGTQFDWGVYASVLARAPIGNGVSTHVFSSEIDFGHTISYAGSLGVTVSGVLYENETLTSVSGIDWLNAMPLPEPGTWALMLVGVGGVCRVARRRQGDRH